MFRNHENPRNRLGTQDYATEAQQDRLRKKWEKQDRLRQKAERFDKQRSMLPRNRFGTVGRPDYHD